MQKILESIILDSFDSLAQLEKCCRDATDAIFIFRGTTIECSKEEEKDGVNSKLYYWGKGPAKSKRKNTTKSKRGDTAKFKLFNEYYQPPDMEKKVVEKARRLFLDATSNRTILTSLQHFGGRTNLIDFSRNLNVALFFACDGDSEEDGELILVDTDGLETLEKINYNNPPEIALMEPDSTNLTDKRVIVQHSVFVYAKEGYIDSEKYKAIPIHKDFKNKLLKHLWQMHNVHTDSIYNDLLGFVENEQNYETALSYFYRGNAYANNREYNSAITDYNRTIDLRPYDAMAYNNRGSAYAEKGEYDSAIADYNKTIDLEPDLGAPYYNRGITFLIQQKWDKARSDLSKAQEKRFDIVVAFKNDFETLAAFEEKYKVKVPDDIAEMLGGR